MSDLDALLRRVASDSLAPYVIDAWRAVDASARAGTLDRSPVGEAALRHLNLVLADDPVGCTPCPPTALRDAARQRITADRHSKDPLRRYLSLRRSELADLVGKPRQQDARSQAQRTWHDMRRSEALSEAFDRHMIRRASAHVRANPIAGATRVLVDIGGGPGQYVQQIMNHLGADWRALIIESYPSAGWLLRQDGTEIQGRVQLKQDGSWADLPAGAGVYLLGSILHNLGDEAASILLRSCSSAAHTDSQVVVVERTWNPARLRDSSRDLDMRLLFGGRERSNAELFALFTGAGLTINDISLTPDEYRVLTGRTAGDCHG